MKTNNMDKNLLMSSASLYKMLAIYCLTVPSYEEKHVLRLSKNTLSLTADFSLDVEPAGEWEIEVTKKSLTRLMKITSKISQQPIHLRISDSGNFELRSILI